MYVAVKGGEKAIAAAHQLLACERRGNPQVNELGCDQIEQQLGLSVDRVMSEGGIYDRELAAEEAASVPQETGDSDAQIAGSVAAADTTAADDGQGTVETADAEDVEAFVVDEASSVADADIPDGYEFLVDVSMPLLGRLIRYEGWLLPEENDG